MADQLAIWNVALAHVGERRLAALNEPREPARVLADEWVAAVTGCLEMANWSFATRTTQLNTQGAAPSSFPNSFTKPSDWIRTADIAGDAGLTVPLDGYIEEGPYWYATPTTIWVRYVSSDPNVGFNVGLWSQQFADLVALKLAERICRRLTGSSELLAGLVQQRQEAAQDALAYEEQTAARQLPAPTQSGATPLQIYNDALTHLGRGRIYSLTQANETVRALNDQFKAASLWALQQAPWQFASRSAGIPSDRSGAYGLLYGFTKPNDWVMTLDIATEASFTQPVLDLVDEAFSWEASFTPLYVRYVSSDPAYGLQIAYWPQSFIDLVALRLAELCAGRLGADKALEAVTTARTAAEQRAKAIETERAARTRYTDPANPTRLQIYNDALTYLQHPRLSALVQSDETVRELNDQWLSSARWCLQQAPWGFAICEYSAATVASARPIAGFTQQVAKPIDWVSTVDLAQDAVMQIPLGDYADEAGLWLTNSPTLAARYISTSEAYGLNLTNWPPFFADLMALRLAERTALRLGVDKDVLASVQKMREEATARAAAYEAEATAYAVQPVDPHDRARLAVLNEALAHLGRRRLVSLSESRADLRELRQRLAPAALWCLEQGPWTFATRTVVALPGYLQPIGGFTASWVKPPDWVKTVALSATGDFLHQPLRHYLDGDGVWYTRSDGLAVQYISGSEDWGLNPTLWSESFRNLLALRLAEQGCLRLGGSAAQMAALVELRRTAMRETRANDALNTPVAYAPPGSWTRSRTGRCFDGGWGAGQRPPTPVQTGLGGNDIYLGGSAGEQGGDDSPPTQSS